MMNELNALWQSLPPLMQVIIPAACGTLLPYGYKWLRHRHLENALKTQDGLRDELNACQKTTLKLTEPHSGLVAQVNATLPQLIQQAQTCPPEQRQAQHEKLAQWLATWQSPLGDHAAHLARAKQADPENPPQVWLHIALLAAALGNRQAAELLIEDELEMLAGNQYLENNEHAWERLFATIRPKRQQDLALQHRHANNQGVRALEQADYEMAGKWLRFGLYLAEIVYDPEHPNVATSLNNLSALYAAQGNYAQAKPLMLRALTIFERTLGKHHSNVAQSLNNLGTLYREQGNYTQAELLWVEALAIREQLLDKHHPDVAESLNNLAGLYRDQGNYTQAEALFVRALAIREQALGAQHPDVAKSLGNLASLYQAQGNYTQAEPLMLRALAIREQVLGAQHPHVASSLNNLAAPLYAAQGNYAQAEPLMLRALAILEQALGAHHPDVAIALENLAVLYRATNREPEAVELNQRAAAIRAIQR
jgi:tetratricopeptide (TPR) repeat protein